MSVKAEFGSYKSTRDNLIALYATAELTVERFSERCSDTAIRNELIAMHCEHTLRVLTDPQNWLSKKKLIEHEAAQNLIKFQAFIVRRLTAHIQKASAPTSLGRRVTVA